MVNENVHLNSSHCHAIANANYSMFTNLLQENTDEDVYLQYLEQWIRYQDLAHYKEEKDNMYSALTIPPPPNVFFRESFYKYCYIINNYR